MNEPQSKQKTKTTPEEQRYILKLLATRKFFAIAFSVGFLGLQLCLWALMIQEQAFSNPMSLKFVIMLFFFYLYLVVITFFDLHKTTKRIKGYKVVPATDLTEDELELFDPITNDDMKFQRIMKEQQA